MTEKQNSISKMCIIGVGLIGGSFALALREAGLVGEVVGVGRGIDNLKKGVELGIIDSFTTDPVEGVADADLIFLATPVLAMAGVMEAIADNLKPGAIITDGGSVKEAIIDAVEPRLPAGVHFVPGHPIAGTEHSGAEAAFPTLYQGRRCYFNADTQHGHGCFGNRSGALGSSGERSCGDGCREARPGPGCHQPSAAHGCLRPCRCRQFI